jgi:hypothetical protein
MNYLRSVKGCARTHKIKNGNVRTEMAPKVAVEWLALPLRIREVLVQILTQGSAILTEILVVFFSSSREIPG